MAKIVSASKSAPTREIPLTPAQFTRAVVAALAPLANRDVAPWMRAYMKDQYDFLGIKTPARRAAAAALIRAQKDAPAAELFRCARALWALPEREYQYVAIDLLARYVRKLAPEHIPALLALVQKKSWWDTVDALSSVINRVVCAGCAADPAIQALMDDALTSKNFWVRRVALLHQLGWRAKTDSKRLFGYATSCAHEEEFFIRKAIGWALRDYARHAPKEVRAFLREHREVLSPLTVREAEKHLL